MCAARFTVCEGHVPLCSTCGGHGCVSLCTPPDFPVQLLLKPQAEQHTGQSAGRRLFVCINTEEEEEEANSSSDLLRSPRSLVSPSVSSVGPSGPH